MIGLIARRLLAAIPMLLAVATVSFLLLQLVPGNPASVLLGGHGTPAQYAQVEHSLGLDRPILVQYAHYMGSAFRGDLGKSLISGQPVLTLLNQRAHVTLALAGGATILAVLFGIGLGTLSATRGGWVDRVVVWFAGLGTAVPNFWIGVLLVLVFAIWIPLFPATGFTPFTESPVLWLQSLTLATIAVAVSGLASITRQTRASILDVLGKDYIVGLRAAGISERVILYKHALRNASVAVVTVVGLQFIGMLSGAIVVEQVFVLPGMSQLVVEAVKQRDIPLVQGLVIYMTVVVLLVNLLIDVMYLWLNPKVRKQ